FIIPEEVEQLLLELQDTDLSLIPFLVQRKNLDFNTIAHSLAKQITIPYVDLTEMNVKSLPHNIIADALIKEYRILPISIKNNELFIAITEPYQLDLMQEICFHVDCTVKAICVAWNKLDQLIEIYLSQKQYDGMNNFNSHSESSDQKENQVALFLNHILLDAI